MYLDKVLLSFSEGEKWMNFRDWAALKK